MNSYRVLGYPAQIQGSNLVTAVQNNYCNLAENANVGNGSAYKLLGVTLTYDPTGQNQVFAGSAGTPPNFRLDITWEAQGTTTTTIWIWADASEASDAGVLTV